MAARFARPIALARLGTSHHEPSLLARRKGTVEERSYLFGEEFRRYVENDLMKRLRTRRRSRLARSASGGNHSDVLNRDVLS